MAPIAPIMAKTYVTILMGLDMVMSSAFSVDTSANPNSGAVNTADSVAYIPMSVRPFRSLPNLLNRSLTQVHSAATTPVSPASGPTDPPKTSGSTAPADMTPTLSYS